MIIQEYFGMLQGFCSLEDRFEFRCVGMRLATVGKQTQVAVTIAAINKLKDSPSFGFS